MISIERVAEVLDSRIEIEENTLLSIDDLVDECISDKMENTRTKRNMKNQCQRRIDLLKEIKEELLE